MPDVEVGRGGVFTLTVLPGDMYTISTVSACVRACVRE